MILSQVPTAEDPAFECRGFDPRDIELDHLDGEGSRQRGDAGNQGDDAQRMSPGFPRLISPGVVTPRS
jgi:hypothetical protein